MFEYLDKLENFNQLNKKYLGSRISSVAGSSVGAVGGVLTIVGLALTPATAGLSLGLTICGISLGVTSLTKVGANKNEEKKANETFEDFRKDVEVLDDCLSKAVQKKIPQKDLSAVADKLSLPLVSEVGTTLDTASASTMFKPEREVRGAGKVTASGRAAKMVGDLPDIGQAAARGAAASARAARGGFLAVNAVLSLAKNSKSRMAELIRARAPVWRSQLKAWEKICTSQTEGEKRITKHQAVLEMPFYPGCHAEDKSSPDPF